jgi:uncharacterized protein (TIGR02266 family)
MAENASALAGQQREVQIEKRRTERTPLEIRVEYSTVDALFSDFTRNINEGGLFIETSDPCAIDTVVTLRFQLPGGADAIHTTGRVVRVGPDGDANGMGIEFEDLDAAARARIDGLVRGLREGRA